MSTRPPAYGLAGARPPRLPGAAALAAGALTGAALGAAGSVAVATGAVAVPLALVGLIGLMTVMSVAGARRVLLAIVVVDIALQLDAYLNYRPELAELGAASGWVLSIATLALGGLYALWAAELLLRPAAAPKPRAVVLALPAAYVLVTAASVLVARDAVVAGFEVNLLVQALLLFVYVSSTVRTRDEVRFLVLCLLGTMIAESALAVGARLSGAGLSVAGTAADGRLMGSFASPNEAGAYFAFLTIMAAPLVIGEVDRTLRRVAAWAVLLGFAALVLSLSRGSWVAFAVGVLVLLFGARGSRGVRVARPGVVVLVLALALLLVPVQGALTARLSGDEGAASSRLPLMALAVDMIEDRPVLGVGANNFGLAMPDYAGADYARTWLYVVHNTYLVIAAQAGVVALALFVAILLVVIRRAWRARRGSDPLIAAVALGLVAALAGHAAHMQADIFNQRPLVQLFWLAAALALAPALRLAAPDRR